MIELNKLPAVILIAALIGLWIYVPLIAYVVLGLFGFGALLFLLLHIYVYGSLYLDGRRLRRTLRKQNRVMKLEEAARKISQGQGTILVEAPTPGWNVNRIWWCADNEVPLGDEKERIEKLCTPEDCENYDRYISEQTGTASLVNFFIFTGKMEKFITDHFRRVEYVFVPSALVRVRRKMDSAN